MTRSASTVAALFDEALTGLWRARRMTIVSILQIAVSIFLVGVFLLAAENLKGVVDAVRDETAVTVYLQPKLTEAERLEIEKVARDSRLVETIRVVDAEEARRRFVGVWPSLSKAALELPSNPFPATLELELKKDAIGSEAIPGLLTNLAAKPGVEEVQFDVEFIRRLRGIVSLIRAAGIGLGLGLALGAAFTIANVVRLTILLHRDEIDILRLVGAPELLIRGPFLVGALAQGVLGAGAALGGLWAAFQVVVRYVAATHNVLLGVFVVRFLPAAMCLVLVGGGLLAGLLGGLVAVRKKLEG